MTQTHFIDNLLYRSLFIAPNINQYINKEQYNKLKSSVHLFVSLYICFYSCLICIFSDIFRRRENAAKQILLFCLRRYSLIKFFVRYL